MGDVFKAERVHPLCCNNGGTLASQRFQDRGGITYG